MKDQAMSETLPQPPEDRNQRLTTDLLRDLSGVAEPRANAMTGSLERKQFIFLIINGLLHRLNLTEGLSVLLGRPDDNKGIRPDIDLNKHGGAANGVSRVHARVEYREGKLWVTDLGSSNGTFIEGQRITPNAPHQVRAGQTLHLGKLRIVVQVPES
jgi:hypothetical protein